MSIQPGRLLARTIEQIGELEASGRARAFAWSWASSGRDLGLLEWVALPHASAAGAYATLLHFWCDTLCDFLRRRGESAQFAGAANWAMCQRMNQAELEAWLDRYGARESRSPGGVVEAYRMIDGSCRASCVARSDDTWLAAFWAHGWSARPLSLPTRSVRV